MLSSLHCAEMGARWSWAVLKEHCIFDFLIGVSEFLHNFIQEMTWSLRQEMFLSPSGSKQSEARVDEGQSPIYYPAHQLKSSLQVLSSVPCLQRRGGGQPWVVSSGTLLVGCSFYNMLLPWGQSWWLFRQLNVLCFCTLLADVLIVVKDFLLWFWHFSDFNRLSHFCMCCAASDIHAIHVISSDFLSVPSVGVGGVCIFFSCTCVHAFN